MQKMFVSKVPYSSILPKCKNIINSKNIIASFFILFLIASIVIKPARCINSVYSGLCVWAKCVLPSLLPFMLFTKILTSLNFISKLTNRCYRINRLLFKAPKISSYIFLMSAISGYPVGAKLISEYYQMRLITSNEANKLSTFCSTSGPLFIIGSVGTAMLGNVKLGYILFISHILGSILNGIVYRNMYCSTINNTKNAEISNQNQIADTDINNNQNIENLLSKSMRESIISIMVVGGFIAISFLIIDILLELNIFYPINAILNHIGISNNISNSFLSGIFEVSKGCIMISNITISKIIFLPIISFLIGFGGISVFMQATTFLKEAKVNLKFYAFQKFNHGVLSGIICYLICLVFNI